MSNYDLPSIERDPEMIEYLFNEGLVNISKRYTSVNSNYFRGYNLTASDKEADLDYFDELNLYNYLSDPNLENLRQYSKILNLKYLAKGKDAVGAYIEMLARLQTQKILNENVIGMFDVFSMTEPRIDQATQCVLDLALFTNEVIKLGSDLNIVFTSKRQIVREAGEIGIVRRNLPVTGHKMYGFKSIVEVHFT